MLNIKFNLFLVFLFYAFNNTTSFIIRAPNTVLTQIDKNKFNPFRRKNYEKLINSQKNGSDNNGLGKSDLMNRKYHMTRPSYIEEVRNLNSKNLTIQTKSILGLDNQFYNESESQEEEYDEDVPKIRIFLPKSKSSSSSSFLKALGIEVEENENTSGYFDEDEETGRRRYVETPNSKSKNFEVIKNFNIKFKDVGGYENVKEELKQCVDILKNYQKYTKYNIRIPRGLILEGPPGTGKTLLAKALAGEAQCNFIPVSGSDFQEKYVGVGYSRIKELFELAKKNVPCIIFVDEIDAVGRKRSADGESSSNERDNTLNALLVELDGFKNNSCIFLVAATNRIDLLDSALTRPGRIDKKIYIGLPDKNTRSEIIKIHINGKPYCDSIGLDELVDVTEGLSGAQIENLLNEAMLNALRMNNTQFCYKDFDFVMNKMIAGWQPNDHEFTTDIIDHIAIHEMGHAIVGLLSKHHSKVTKVVINLSSPKSPGYTVFEGSTSNIYIR